MATLGIAQCNSIDAQSFLRKFKASFYALSFIFFFKTVFWNVSSMFCQQHICKAKNYLAFFLPIPPKKYSTPRRNEQCENSALLSCVCACVHHLHQVYEVPCKGPVPYSGLRPYSSPQRDFFAPFEDHYFTTQWSTITGPSPIAVHAPLTVHGS